MTPAPSGPLAGVLARPRYEVIPLPGIERDVADSVPKAVKLTVTASPRRGLDSTLELTERLVGHGFEVVPHLSARLVRDEPHLEAILRRLDDLAVRDAFVIAGDLKQPAGRFAGAAALLRAMAELGHGLREVGIAGYPESHPLLSDEITIRSMSEKEALATYIVSQMCFDAQVIAGWIRRVRERGTRLPIHIGLPGAVDRIKLLRVSTRIGLGESARFLRKHTNVLTTAFLPGSYTPEPLLESLAPSLADPDANVAGLHIYTFNDVERTEAWRRELVRRLAGV